MLQLMLSINGCAWRKYSNKMAIARDTFAFNSDWYNGGSGQSYTCTGSNLVLEVFLDGDFASDNNTGVSYGGHAMSQVDNIPHVNPSNRQKTSWILVNPPTGPNTITITDNGTHFAVGWAISYTGAAQSGQPDNHGTLDTGATSGSSIDLSLTTVANNAWITSMHISDDSVTTHTPPNGGVNALVDDQHTVVNAILTDTNAAMTPAGSYLMGDALGASRGFRRALLMSIAPFTSATNTSRFFRFLRRH